MQRPTTILGLNAFHGDSSAALFVDGRLVAAAEEERFRRVKHWAGLPTEAARACLRHAGVDPSDLQHVAVNRDPSAHFLSKVAHALRNPRLLASALDRRRNARRVGGLREELAFALGVDANGWDARFHQVEHHRAHLASAFLVSPFERAAVASVDGFGDFSSSMWAHGVGKELVQLGRVGYPHSLGVFYLALTQYLGFPNYGDEYKVMGMAAYGEPRYVRELENVVRTTPEGFELDLSYFLHTKGGVAMTWDGGEPTVARAFSRKLEDLLGPARRKGDELTQRHRDLAASTQAVFEQVYFDLLRRLARSTGEKRLCLAGGCAMNSLANGRITERTPFEEVWIQAAAGDAGGAIGAAASVWCDVLGRERVGSMEHAYLGPEFAQAELDATLHDASEVLEEVNCAKRRFDDEEQLCDHVARHIAAGHVVGWFQGRMEWGARALGNRSIVGDPRRADMKDVLNLKIKRRESFRPFAPSVLEEKAAEWFERPQPVPFMSMVLPIREEKREWIPAVTHADGTGRLQTVSKDTNPRYHRLITAFMRRTGVPMILNTSFNENEPVVCRPEEALDCFLRTKMDVLVLGDAVLERTQLPTDAGVDVETIPGALPAPHGVRVADDVATYGDED
ncbi:MAG: carbamoyltransferase C-terminal domain-containing protein [Planctomycetota bacterium]